MQTTSLLVITCFIFLLSLRSLINRLIKDIKGIKNICYSLYRPRTKTNTYSKSDYNKAFNYLLKRKSINPTEQTEEKLFFLSLINQTSNVKQLKTFTQHIKKFYKKKISYLSNRRFKEQKETYTQQYKDIVIFLIMAIENRLQIINEFAQYNTYQDFANPILEAEDIAEVDAILILAEKLKRADYKKTKQLADQKKATLSPYNATNTKVKTANRFSLTKLIAHLISSTIKYPLLCYLVIISSSLILSLSIPYLVTTEDNQLLHIAKILKKQTYIPQFAKLNTQYRKLGNNKIQFYTQTNFLKQQKQYYQTKLTNKACHITIFQGICHKLKK